MIFYLDLVSDITNGIVNGLTNFFGSIGNTILDFIIWLLSSAINLLFLPINLLFTIFFTDLSNTISTAVDNINVFIANIHNLPISFFVHILPSNTRTALLIYLSFLIGYYVFVFSYRSIRVVINIFHKIKFW